MPDTITLNGEKFVTVSSLSRHTGASTGTIHQYIKSGFVNAMLHPFLKATRYVISEAEVKRLLGL
jgi:predicted site-specific integrase-resolvase